MKKFILGFIIGGVICAAVTGFAVEYAVTANPFPITVNGTEKAIEGYNINDSTYFKLRDVADAVGGFEVGFAYNTITITTADAPAATPASVDLSAAIVRGDDGKDYTADGIEVEYVDGVAYVDEADIQHILNEKGATNYSFSTTSLLNTDTLKSVISNIPRCKSDTRLIPLDFYISDFVPFLNAL